jgi:hypothetical protein
VGSYFQTEPPPYPPMLSPPMVMSTIGWNLPDFPPSPLALSRDGERVRKGRGHNPSTAFGNRGWSVMKWKRDEELGAQEEC